MKITITRSAERTRQIADFVPIKAYCAASMEIEASAEGFKNDPKIAEDISQLLDRLVWAEVDKTLMSYYPQCIVCGGKGQKMSLNKEGVCGQCVTQAKFQAQEFAAAKDNHNTPKVGTKNNKNHE